MAKAHSFIPKHDPQFFPEQNGTDSPGAPADRFRLKTPDTANAANTNEQVEADSLAPASDEAAVWNRYDPSGSAMFDKPELDAKNVHSSSRWLVRGMVAAFFIAGVGIAAATYQARSPAEPAAVEDASSAAAPPAIQNPREASASPALSGAVGATALAEPASAEPTPPAAKAPPAVKAPAAKPAAKAAPAQPDPANNAAAPTYSNSPASPANPTGALPSTMPSESGPPAPSNPSIPPATLDPAPVPGTMPFGSTTPPEISPGNEPTPQ